MAGDILSGAVFRGVFERQLRKLFALQESSIIGEVDKTVFFFYKTYFKPKNT